MKARKLRRNLVNEGASKRLISSLTAWLLPATAGSSNLGKVENKADVTAKKVDWEEEWVAAWRFLGEVACLEAERPGMGVAEVAEERRREVRFLAGGVVDEVVCFLGGEVDLGINEVVLIITQSIEVVV